MPRGSAQTAAAERELTCAGAYVRACVCVCVCVLLLRCGEQNLLLSGDEQAPTLKIAHFGLAKFVQIGIADRTRCGSPLYMAPEVVQPPKATRSSPSCGSFLAPFALRAGERRCSLADTTMPRKRMCGPLAPSSWRW